MLRQRVPAALVVFGLSLLGVEAFGQQPGERFRRWDANGDGKVSREEIPPWFRGQFDEIDANKDGAISPDEEQKFRPAGGGQRRVPDSVRVERDLAYAASDNPKQKLDLYLPKTPTSDKPLPLVVFVHGGAWRTGDKSTGYYMVAPLVESGDYAGACISYRLSGEATWPAQIFDCKAAIRFLRANADKFHLDPDRIGVMGNSAGGHLVALLGTSGGVAELEGTLGENSSVSSRVTCVVDQFGDTDFTLRPGAPDGPVSKLLGVDVTKDKAAALAASPIKYVSKTCPPFLFIHGTEDPAVQFKQSEVLDAALRAVGVDSTLVPVKGGGHGNFGTPEVPQRVRQFFDKHLRGQEVVVSAEPIAMPSNNASNSKKAPGQ